MTQPAFTWHYLCLGCQAEYRPEQFVWQCPSCGGELAVEGLQAELDSPDDSAIGLWRYESVLPVSAPASGTMLGEGASPLIQIELDGHPVYLKLDSQLPTGSFKDRGAAVLARFLSTIGVKRIIVDSSGNAAASMSAYAAASGLHCTVYVPANASPGKLSQARAYGATVIPVDGSRDDVAFEAQEAAESDSTASYASHNWHPIFVEGVKTWALEVYEQLGGRNPDIAFVPTGGGSSFVGAYRGFSATGEHLPRLVAAQPEACAPIVRAWEEGGAITKVEAGATVAEGTKIALPSRPLQIQYALGNSDGLAIAVSEELLRQTCRDLWRLGIYAEPTGVLGVAAFRTGLQDGTVSGGDVAVIHITGHGLKSTPVIEEILAESS